MAARERAGIGWSDMECLSFRGSVRTGGFPRGGCFVALDRQAGDQAIEKLDGGPQARLGDSLVDPVRAETIGGRERTYKQVRLTDLSWELMRNTASELVMVFPHAKKMLGKSAKGGRSGRTTPLDVPSDLLATLRDVRAQLSRSRDVPAYVVAPNKTLEDMARIRPTTKGAMLTVHGMGPTRFHLYGEAFLAAVRAYNQGQDA